MPPDSYGLDELHRVQFEVLQSFATFCNANGLNFCLLAGSALGARRHGGIIPWDDDIDVGMMRSDYDALVTLRDNLPDGLFLQEWMHDPHLPAPIAKLRKDGTAMVEKTSKNVAGHKGIFIDIFPLDAVPENKWSTRSFYSKVLFLKRALRHKLGYSTRYLGFPLFIADFAAKLFSLVISAEFMKEALDHAIRSAAKSPGDKVVAVAGSYSLAKETLASRWIRDATNVAFESGTYPCPHPIDEYLRHLYGENFMQPPPLNRRAPKHPLERLEFS